MILEPILEIYGTRRTDIENKIRDILLGLAKPKGRPATKFKLPPIPVKKIPENVQKFFADTKDKAEVEDTIIRALEAYLKNEEA